MVLCIYTIAAVYRCGDCARWLVGRWWRWTDQSLVQGRWRECLDWYEPAHSSDVSAAALGGSRYAPVGLNLIWRNLTAIHHLPAGVGKPCQAEVFKLLFGEHVLSLSCCNISFIGLNPYQILGELMLGEPLILCHDKALDWCSQTSYFREQYDRRPCTLCTRRFSFLPLLFRSRLFVKCHRWFDGLAVCHSVHSAQSWNVPKSSRVICWCGISGKSSSSNFIRRCPQLELRQITLKNCCIKQKYKKGRLLFGQPCGTLERSTTLIFHKRLWCADTLRIKLRLRSHWAKVLPSAAPYRAAIFCWSAYFIPAKSLDNSPNC